jgi:hypothetical protein
VRRFDGRMALSPRDGLIVARHEVPVPFSEAVCARRALQFGHLKTGFHFVPEGHTIVARRFIAGLAVHRDLRPRGTLEVGIWAATNPPCRIGSRWKLPHAGPPSKLSPGMSKRQRVECSCASETPGTPVESLGPMGSVQSSRWDGLFPYDSRHFVPGYYRAVPPGQKPFAHRSASKLS